MLDEIEQDFERRYGSIYRIICDAGLAGTGQPGAAATRLRRHDSG
jgi:hypothetical protein